MKATPDSEDSEVNQPTVGKRLRTAASGSITVRSIIITGSSAAGSINIVSGPRANMTVNVRHEAAQSLSAAKVVVDLTFSPNDASP